MILDVLNVVGIVLIFACILVVITTGVDFLFTKKLKKYRFIISIIFLFIGMTIILFVQKNNNYLKQSSKLYSDASNAIPLSVTLVANSKINYFYDKSCLGKGIHNGKTFFKINNLKINKYTVLKIKQEYRDSFLVPTIREDNFIIIRK